MVDYTNVPREYALYERASKRAKEKGLEFDITPYDIIIPECCPVLGLRLNISPNIHNLDCSPSLDRIDNNRGYIKGNVIVVSFKANTIKSSATVEELKLVYSFYKRLSDNRYLKYKYTHKEFE